jgi:hypothetical protein
MPKMQGLIPPSKVQEVLEFLEDRVDRDTEGNSTYPEVQKRWRALRKKFEVTLWDRPDNKLRRHGSEATLDESSDPSSEERTASSRPSNRATTIQEKIRQRMEKNQLTNGEGENALQYPEIESVNLIEDLTSTLEGLNHDEKGRAVVEYLDNLVKEVASGRYKEDKPLVESKYEEDTIAVDLPQELMVLKTIQKTLEGLESLISQHQLKRFVVWDPEEPRAGDEKQWYLGKGEKPHKIDLGSYLNRLQGEFKRKEERERTTWETYQRDT